MRDLIRRRRALEAYIKLVSLYADIMRSIAKHRKMDPMAAGYWINKMDSFAYAAAGEITFIDWALAKRRHEVAANLEYYNRMERL